MKNPEDRHLRRRHRGQAAGPAEGAKSQPRPGRSGCVPPPAVERMGPQHVRGAVMLHMAQQPHTFASRLGEGFLRRLHRRVALSRHGLALVQAAGERIRSSLLATYHAGRLRRELALRDGLATLPAVARAVVRRPSLLGQVLELSDYASKTEVADVEAEIFALNVDPEIRGHGVAAGLMLGALAMYRDRGVSRVKTATEAENLPVNQLLSTLGFVRLRDFEFQGKHMILHLVEPRSAVSAMPPSCPPRGGPRGAPDPRG